MRANDEPHGVFTLNPEHQSITVVGEGLEVSRVLVLNVTRLAGLFGNASVGYRITGGIDGAMGIEEILGEEAEGRVFLREGETFTTVTVTISSQVRRLKDASAKTSYMFNRFQQVPNTVLQILFYVIVMHVLIHLGHFIIFLLFLRCFCLWVRASQQS